jgi:hypothetical protein
MSNPSACPQAMAGPGRMHGKQPPVGHLILCYGAAARYKQDEPQLQSVTEIIDSPYSHLSNSAGNAKKSLLVTLLANPFPWLMTQV